MAMLERLLEFLNQSQVGYTHHVHPTAFTAREVASIEHLPAHEFAKTVVFHGDNGFGMAVLPADSKDGGPNWQVAQGKILVPFCIESALSGVKQPLTGKQRVISDA